MHLISTKTVLAAGWVLVVGIGAIAGDFRALSSWILLAGVAVFPPIIMMWLWNDPGQTMSESIQQARK